MRSGAMVAALITTNGPSARRELAWISRATTSLPTPGGPLISTREPVIATRWIALRDLLDRRRAADQLALVAELELELGVLALEPRRLAGALDQHQQAVGVERLLEEVVGALLDRGDRGLDGAVAADHDHRQLARAAPDVVEHLQAVEPRALEPDVEQHEARRARFDLGQRRRPVAAWRTL